MTVEEAAKKLKINPQTLRLALRQNLMPFGKAVLTTPIDESKTGVGRWTYWINEELLEKFLNGELK